MSTDIEGTAELQGVEEHPDTADTSSNAPPPTPSCGTYEITTDPPVIPSEAFEATVSRLSRRFATGFVGGNSKTTVGLRLITDRIGRDGLALFAVLCTFRSTSTGFCSPGKRAMSRRLVRYFNLDLPVRRITELLRRLEKYALVKTTERHHRVWRGHHCEWVQRQVVGKVVVTGLGGHFVVVSRKTLKRLLSIQGRGRPLGSGKGWPWMRRDAVVKPKRGAWSRAPLAPGVDKRMSTTPENPHGESIKECQQNKKRTDGSQVLSSKEERSTSVTASQQSPAVPSFSEEAQTTTSTAPQPTAATPPVGTGPAPISGSDGDAPVGYERGSHPQVEACVRLFRLAGLPARIVRCRCEGD